jgi:hypothetical protein
VKGEASLDEVKNDDSGHIFVNAQTSRFWVEHLPKLTNLKRIHVEGRSVSLALIEALATLPNIEKLDIDLYTSPSIEPLFELKKLTHLFLFYTKVEVDYRGLASLPNLRSLELGLPRKLDNIEAMQTFSNGSLELLFLTSTATPMVNVASMHPLKHIQSLKYLTFGNIKAKDKSLAFIKDMPNLKTLCTMDNIKHWNV